MRDAESGNRFAGPAACVQSAEVFAPAHPDMRIERIVSSGQDSPPAFGYEPPGEVRMLLPTGEARLRFAGETRSRALRPGDRVRIAAHSRHRAESAANCPSTIWLTAHPRTAD